MNGRIYNIKKRQRQFLLVFVDIFTVIMASYVALLVRFDFRYGSIPIIYLRGMLSFLPILIIGTIIVFYYQKLYHSIWSMAGRTEVHNIIGATFMVFGILIFGMLALSIKMPRSFYLIFAVSHFIMTVAIRFSYRSLIYFRRKGSSREITIPVMIIGAGEAGRLLIEEINRSQDMSYISVECIIDDDTCKQDTYINGIRVIGTRDDIKHAVKDFNIKEIIIAMPSAPKKEVCKIVEICELTSCKLKILPRVYQLLNEDVKVTQLRNVEIDDLLGRDVIKMNLNQIMNYVMDKVVLITGGGGSIGSELCRQIALYQPKQIIIFDIYENNAYDIQLELQRNFPKLNLVTLVGSVRNKERLSAVFKQYEPDIVYHAAAHKHVPLMEDSPNEAIKNNVLGTLNTVKVADECSVERFVLISSDKAVNPTNVMGATKRICEMIIQEYNAKSTTEYVAVRFGNVLGSNGSVIPLFKKQIAVGGPVTVTHPDIIRYFMTITEAVYLVLQAGAYAKDGDILVLDMGEPVKILDLAKNLIRMSGYKVNEDIIIEYIGLRPGEKLYEELLMDEEGLKETTNELIHIGQPINIDSKLFWERIEKLKVACHEEDHNIRQVIQEIVPTYTIQETTMNSRQIKKEHEIEVNNKVPHIYDKKINLLKQAHSENY